MTIALFSRCKKLKSRVVSKCGELWKRVDHEVLFAFATIMYFADVISDIVLGITYLRDSDIWHGAITLLFVIISHIIFSVVTIATFYQEKTFLLILKCILFPQPILIFIQWWKYDFDKYEPNRDLKFDELTGSRKTMSLMELFFESIPQLCLQAYIIIAIQGYITTLQIVTCSISLLAASYGTLSIFYGFYVKCFVFVTSIFWLFTRAVTIAMLGCIKTYMPFVFAIANLVILFLLDTYDRYYDPYSRMDIFSSFLSAVSCSFLPITSLRNFEVATFLILGNGIAFVASAKFGTIKNNTLEKLLVNTTTTTNITWLSPNDTYIYQGMNKTLLLKHDTSDVLLSEWEYFQPLMIVFIVFSILSILPLAVNFVLLAIRSRHYFEFDNVLTEDCRLPKLLKLNTRKEITALIRNDPSISNKEPEVLRAMSGVELMLLKNRLNRLILKNDNETSVCL